MTNRLNLAVGDIVTVKRTMQVVSDDYRVITLSDVKEPHQQWNVLPVFPGSLKVTMVKKAAPKRKYKAGDKLTARELQDHQWKRGTVFVDPDGYVHMLLASGRWIVSDRLGDSEVDFRALDVYEDKPLTIVHLP